MNKSTKEQRSKKGPARKDGKRTRRQPAKQGAIETLIKKFEESLQTDSVKPTVSEYIRLKQLHKELDAEEPKEIKVTWVEPNEKESVTET
jgi:ribosomal protein S20